jgi:hypothetical protein
MNNKHQHKIALNKRCVQQGKRLAEEMGHKQKMLEETFREEMKSSP